MTNQILQPLSPKVLQRKSTFNYGNGIVLHCKYYSMSAERRWFDDNGREYTEEQIMMKACN